jgi:ribosomal protein S18 acetylase RimI-like enzyme
MVRPLDESLPLSNAPDGFTLRPVTNGQELVVDFGLHQEIFVVVPPIVGDRLTLLHESPDVVALDLVAVAPDGLGGLPPVLNGCQGVHHRPTRVELLGTRPAYRQRGLGRAMVLAGLQQLRAQGQMPLLGTTSWNGAAQRLFASVGFRLVRQISQYAWEDVSNADHTTCLNTPC